MLNNLLPDEVMALTSWGEARGETIEGQIAVGNVIINRMFEQPGRFKNVKDVCLKPLQFSCWNDTDPNYSKLISLAESFINGSRIDPTLTQCLAIARCIINRTFLDNTKTATNYMTNELFYSDKKPGWAKNVKNVKVIGNHTFFSL